MTGGKDDCIPPCNRSPAVLPNRGSWQYPTSSTSVPLFELMLVGHDRVYVFALHEMSEG